MFLNVGIGNTKESYNRRAISYWIDFFCTTLLILVNMIHINDLHMFHKLSYQWLQFSPLLLVQ